MFEGIPDPPNTILWMAKAGLGGLLAAGAAAFAVPAARDYVYPKITSTRLRDHILFDRVLEDRRTVCCTDGTLIQVIEIAGKDLSALAADIQEGLYRRRLDWIHKFAGSGVELRIVTTRELHDNSGGFEAGYPSPTLTRLMETWASSFRLGFRNRHYVLLSIGGGEERARELLRQMVDDTLDYLTDYWPRVVELGEDSQGGSELTTFWASLLNPLMRHETGPMAGRPVKGTRLTELGALDRRLADYLIGSEVEFLDGGGAFQVSLTKRRLNGVAVFQGVHEVWMGSIGIGGYGDRTSVDLLQQVLSLNTEMMAVSHVKVMDDTKAEAMLRERLNRSVNAAANSKLGVNSKLVDHIRQTIELISAKGADHISLVDYQMTVFVFGTGPDDLESRMRDVERVFRAHAMLPVRERAAAEPLWFSVFPPHREWIRPAVLVSPNVATMVTFETSTSGLSRCHWGDQPVTRFRTVSGAAYNFCWQEADRPLAAGHTALFGNTDAGKTTLLNFLAGATLGYADTKVFLIDRGDGSYISTKTFGGKYIHLQSDSKELSGLADLCTMNPLQMELDEADLSSGNTGGPTQWLSQWVRDFLCDLDPEDIESETQIGKAIRNLARMPAEKRSLEQVYNAIPDNFGIKRRLKRWVEGDYRHVFNGATDSLDFSNERMFAFSFDRLLTDPVLARALLPYLAYRIVSDMERLGKPWLLVLDELARLIEDPRFRKWFFELLEESRKKNGVVVFAFQRISSIMDPAFPGLGDLVMQQCPNKIILPNAELSVAEADYMGLSSAEFDIIRGQHPLARQHKYFMLLKRKNEGTIFLQTDLRPLGKDLALLRSGRSEADKLRQLEKKYGINAQDRALDQFRDAA
jgi:type IV secretion/conjugal transfer VirB4 family ATPase